MIYSFQVAFKYLYQHKWIYFLLFLELCLCFTLIFLRINMNQSETNRYEMLREQVADLQVTNLHEQYKPLTDEQYHFATRNLADESQILYYDQNALMTEVNGEFLTSDLLVVSDSFIEKYLTEITESDVYVGEQLVQAVNQKGELEFFDTDYRLDANNFSMGQDLMAFQMIPSQVSNHLVLTPQEFLDIDLNLSIVVRRSAIQSQLGSRHSPMNAFLAFIGPIDGLLEFLNRFEEKYPDRPLNLIQPIELFERGVFDVMGPLDVISWSSIVAFFIIFTGIMGILLIFLEKRRAKIQISLLFGASYSRIFTEILIEILLLTLSASLLSFGLASILGASLSSTYYVIRFSPFSLWAAVCLPLLLSLIPVTLIILSIRKQIGLDRLSHSL